MTASMRFGLQAGLLTSAKLAGGATSLAIGLLLTRALEPGDFGTWSLCMTAIVVADATLGSAVDHAVIKTASVEADAPRRGSLQSHASAGKLAVSALAMAACVAFAGPLAELLLHDAALAPALVAAAAAAGVLLAVRSAFVRLQLDGRLLRYAAMDLLHSASRLGATGAALLAGVRDPALLLLAWAAPTLVIVLLDAAPRGGVATLPRFDPKLARLLLGTCGPMLATFTVSTLAARLDLYVVAALRGPQEAGRLGAAYVVAMIPELVGTYASLALAARILPQWRAGGFARTLVRVQGAGLAVAPVVFLAIWGFSEIAGGFLWRASYGDVPAILLALLPGTLSVMIAFPVLIPFLMYVRPGAILGVELLVLPLMLVAFWWAVPQFGALGAAAVSSGAKILKTALWHVVAWRIVFASGGRA